MTYDDVRTTRLVIEQIELTGMAPPAWNAPMRPQVDAIEYGGKFLRHDCECFFPCARKAFSLPDFVEPAGITAIALEEILAADTEPARNPDIDSIVLGQRATGTSA